jgi:FkbM family methyltransferase
MFRTYSERYIGFSDKGKLLIKKMLGPNYAIRRHLAHELAHGEPEIALVPILCSRDADFLDVGANIGAYSFYAKSHSRHVYAMEPNPALTHHLRAVLGKKGTVLTMGASDHVATAPFCIPFRNGNDVDTRSSLQEDANPDFESRKINIAIAPIDSLGLDHVGVVKIDVEGHELAALNGARRTLEQCRPVAIVECEERHNQGGVERAFRFFDSLGYRPYFIHGGQLRLGEEFDVARFQAAHGAKPVGGMRSPDYINNFIFIHRDNSVALSRIRQFSFEARA